MKLRVLEGIKMALIALIFALFALFCCVYLWLELQKKPSRMDVGGVLSQYSDELKKTYAAGLKDIEAEWENMYQKLMRLVGRADKNRGLEAATIAQPETPRPESRSDILRRHRSGRSS